MTREGEGAGAAFGHGTTSFFVGEAVTSSSDVPISVAKSIVALPVGLSRAAVFTSTLPRSMTSASSIAGRYPPIAAFALPARRSTGSADVAVVATP